MEDFRKNLKQRKRKLQSPLDITDTFNFDVVFIDKFNHADYCCYCDRRYNLGRSIEWFIALHWILCERCLSVFKFISDLSEISEGFFLLHCKKKCSENELCLNIFFIAWFRNHFNLLNHSMSTFYDYVCVCVCVCVLLLLQFLLSFADCKRLSNQWAGDGDSANANIHITHEPNNEKHNANGSKNVINSNKNYVFAFFPLLSLVQMKLVVVLFLIGSINSIGSHCKLHCIWNC